MGSRFSQSSRYSPEIQTLLYDLFYSGYFTEDYFETAIKLASLENVPFFRYSHCEYSLVGVTQICGSFKDNIIYAVYY